MDLGRLNGRYTKQQGKRSLTVPVQVEIFSPRAFPRPEITLLRRFNCFNEKVLRRWLLRRELTTLPYRNLEWWFYRPEISLGTEVTPRKLNDRRNYRALCVRPGVIIGLPRVVFRFLPMKVLGDRELCSLKPPGLWTFSRSKPKSFCMDIHFQPSHLWRLTGKYLEK